MGRRHLVGRDGIASGAVAAASIPAAWHRPRRQCAPNRRTTRLNIEIGPEPDRSTGGIAGAAHWPDTADHRQIRRWIVRLQRPGMASGTGILVGPDLVLTCHHVLQDLFGADAPGSVAAAAEVDVSIGLGDGSGDPVLTRGLRLAHDRAGSGGGPPWHVAPSPAGPELDFALLRLDDGVDTAADWLSFQEFQSPRGLAAGADAAAITFFMYHFPDPADGTPHIEPRLSMAQLPADWHLATGRIGHRVDSERGSSGAMLFATVAGSRPFPIGLHRGRVEASDDKLAVALSAILTAVAHADRPVFGALTTPPAEVRRQHDLQTLAAPQIDLARRLIDRDVQAKAAVGGTVARAKKVQPVFEATATEMAVFQARLAAFDLPLRILPDPTQQQTMRCWTLAGVKGAPPVETGIPKWGIENLGGDTWLRDGPLEAVDALCSRAADAQALGASCLLTARVEVSRASDYRALEDLLLALAQALQGPEAAADVLLLLWIGDSGLSDRARQQGRDVLRRLWAGRALQPVVGMPVQLAALAETDLALWAQDIAGAFNVRRTEVDLAIRRAWTALDQHAPPRGATSRHEFEPVMQALDDPLRNWVYLHFRRIHESAGRQT